MTAWRLTGPAERQMGEALAYSASEYSGAHARNYEALILAAIADVADNYQRIGAIRVPRIQDIWVYEIRHSRNRLPREQRIRNPWHKLVYRRLPDGVVEILAVVGHSYPAGRAARGALATH
jgi:hypothetical protein